jgi:hypothetical protein
MQVGATPAGRVPGYHETIFFAVLENLYVEGVATEDVDLVLAKDPQSGRLEHFVYACPICVPVIDAFLAYRKRPPFYGRKSESDTFGEGWDAAAKAKLKSPHIDDRLEVLNDFVERSLKNKLDSLRLTPEEQKEWQKALAEMREKGMALLKAAQARGEAGAMAQAKGCPSCDGANDGGGNR